jgi:hypothetical protein
MENRNLQAIRKSISNQARSFGRLTAVHRNRRSWKKPGGETALLPELLETVPKNMTIRSNKATQPPATSHPAQQVAEKPRLPRIYGKEPSFLPTGRESGLTCKVVSGSGGVLRLRRRQRPGN